AGVIGASSTFFRKDLRAARKAEFIDEYDDKATMEQAGPWRGLTALTSLFVTPSGFPFLPFPFPNYGNSLNTLFTLSAGRKMIMPYMGDFWMGGETWEKARGTQMSDHRTSTGEHKNYRMYPFGPSEMRDFMIKYAVNNTDKHPKQLDDMAYRILQPFFRDV